MMNRLTPVISAAACAWLLAAGALAAQPIQSGAPATKPAEPAKTAEKAAEKAAKQAGETAEQAEQKAEQKADRSKSGGAARDNREVLEPVAFEQARYNKRSAQLERIKQIAAEKNNEKLSRETEELIMKNDQHHLARLDQLRAKHGAEEVAAALAWIEKRAAERGAIGVVGGAKNQKSEEFGEKAREKAKDKKEKTEDMKEKAKEKVKEKPKGDAN